MLRILRRCVTQSGKIPCSCRKQYSSAVVPYLKWQRTEFNGVDVNLSQLGENCSLEDFDVRLKGRLMQMQSFSGLLRKGRQNTPQLSNSVSLEPIYFDQPTGLLSDDLLTELREGPLEKLSGGGGGQKKMHAKVSAS